MKFIHQILVFLGLSNKSSYLNSRSTATLDVFTKATKELSVINDSAEQEKAKKEAIIAKQQKEHDFLSIVQNQNSKVIEKLNKIFE